MATVKITSNSNFCIFLTIFFVILKLTGTITWSWWWVLSPLWLPFVISLSFAIIVLAFVSIVFILAILFSLISILLERK